MNNRIMVMASGQFVQKLIFCKGDINMIEELTTLVQVLELYGKGAGALGRAIKLLYKAA